MSRVLDGRYEIFEELGQGEILTTYRAWDHQLQHVVVVKLTRPQLRLDRPAIRALEQTWRRVAALPAHRHIASVFALGQDEDAPYAVEEYVLGEPLGGLMAREGSLSVGRAFEIARQVAEALDFAARYGVSHGDLRPEHILITRGGEVKVIDFGIHAAGEATGRLNTWPRRPQNAYLAPEQLGGEAASPSGDIYSLGAVLFEMLTGRLPFEPSGLGDAPADPTEINPAVPPGAATLVMEALAAEPSERFGTPGSFAAALRQYLSLEKGDTARADLPHVMVAPAPAVQAVPAAMPRARPVARRASGANLGLTALFLGALLVAILGGWIVYRAVAGVMGGPGYPATTATACTGGHTGPVKLKQGWIHPRQIKPGAPIVANYPIVNSASTCSRTLLGMTVLPAAHPNAAMVDRAHARVVGAAPGTHVYTRSFVLPASAAGQSFDVVLTVSDPTGTHVYARSRLARALTVTR
jgi:hypothetical protein